MRKTHKLFVKLIMPGTFFQDCQLVASLSTFMDRVSMVIKLYGFVQVAGRRGFLRVQNSNQRENHARSYAHRKIVVHTDFSALPEVGTKLALACFRERRQEHSHCNRQFLWHITMIRVRARAVPQLCRDYPDSTIYPSWDFRTE